jgi:hypothetical protein
MSRIVAFVTIFLTVALLAAQAANKPVLQHNGHLGPEIAPFRIAQLPQGQHAYQANRTAVCSYQRTDVSQPDRNGCVPQNGSNRALGLSPMRNSLLKQASTIRTVLNSDEEEDADDEGREEEDSETGWDRTWDGPKLG